MAETERDQRTEKATPKRRQQLREEGRVVQSVDVGSAVVLAVMATGLAVVAGGLSSELSAYAQRLMLLEDRHEPWLAVRASLPVFGLYLLPLLLVGSLLSLAAGFAQTGGMFNLQLAMPKLERLNPWPPLQRMLPGKTSAAEIGKQLLKVCLIGLVTWLAVHQSIAGFVTLTHLETKEALRFVASSTAKLAAYGVGAFVGIAAFDYWLARRKFEAETRMSRQELREEHRQEEGDPLLKRRLRQRMREAVQRRAISDVRQATVLITNPTHISIALRYDADKDPAPRLLAKGVDEVAMAMRQTARQHGVPIIEHRPLARSLYRDGKVGDAIPVDLYRAAAEIIAHVWNLQRRKEL